VIVGPQASTDKITPVVAIALRNNMLIGRKWGSLVAYTEDVLQDKVHNNEVTVYVR